MVERDKILTSVSDNPALSLILFNPRGEVEWVNDGFRHLHGFGLPDLPADPGLSIYSLYSDKDVTNRLTGCIRDKIPVTLTAGIDTASGERKWVRTYVSPVQEAEDHPQQFLAIETDITDFRQKEEKMQLQYKQLKEVTDNLEKANLLLEDQKMEINKQKHTIEDERNRSEKLLLNILPFEVARQLKSKGRAGSRHYKMVSVVFADFKGFSRLSKTLDPKELVTVLDGYFARFDEIIEKYYLEKIKTIGDAYMFAGGLPLSNRSNPVDAVLAGLEIQHYMNTLNDKKVLDNLPVWELRIGVHTGPVVAGVIGRKRLAYDIWGDTVNIASRMEHGGHVGMVNVSGFTYACIREFFDCDYRGKIETKNQEKTDMYFVNRIKPQYSADRLGMIPNDVMINLVNKL